MRLTDAADTRTHFVYRLFGHDGELHYIGCTNDIETRMALHHVTFGGVMTSVEYPDRAAARDAELAAITAEAPLLNKQHNPKRFKGRAGGGFDAVEPIHPLTAQMLRAEQPVTRAEAREAFERVADRLGIGGAA